MAYNPASIPRYGEFYRNSDATVTIVEANVWHPSIGLVEGISSGITLDSTGEAIAITAVADAGGGDVRLSVAGHSASAGNILHVAGTTNYNGVYIIQAVAAGTIDITATWVATETGWALRGDSMVIGTTELYDFQGGISAVPAVGSNQDWETGMYVNTTLVAKGAPERRFSNTSDIGTLSGGFFLALNAGDILTFVLRNTTAANNLTMKKSNLKVKNF